MPEIRGLEVLDLRGNTIATLPERLKYMRSLLDLDLDGNPIGPKVIGTWIVLSYESYCVVMKLVRYMTNILRNY